MTILRGSSALCGNLTQKNTSSCSWKFTRHQRKDARHSSDQARLIYGRVCQQNKDLRWDTVITHPDLVKMMQQLLWDIVQVREELQPFDRAWIKENYQLNMVIGPYDGSIEGYGGLQYVRSFNEKTGDYDCNLASARSKCSDHDVGDNELSGSL